MKKKKLNIDEVLDREHINTFEDADKKESEHKELKRDLGNTVNKGGRPLASESKATEKIAFHITKEVKTWLETMTDTKNRTPNAIIKKIVMQQYDLHK